MTEMQVPVISLESGHRTIAILLQENNVCRKFYAKGIGDDFIPLLAPIGWVRKPTDR